MDYLELSIKSVEEKSIKLAKSISHLDKPDIVIFISKGAYQIGQVISDYYDVPLLEVFAKRKVGKLKKLISPILKIIPTSIKRILREKEIKSNIHEGNTDRNVYFDEKIWSKYIDATNVLIVDDSVDTGNTISQVEECVKKYFNKSKVLLAALNVFSKSESNVKINYYLLKDTMLNGPWSNDSKENKKFSLMYKEWKEEN